MMMIHFHDRIFHALKHLRHCFDAFSKGACVIKHLISGVSRKSMTKYASLHSVSVLFSFVALSCAYKFNETFHHKLNNKPMRFTNNFASQQKSSSFFSWKPFFLRPLFLMWRDRFDDGKSKFQAEQ
jgi:hypothetical protein